MRRADKIWPERYKSYDPGSTSMHSSLSDLNPSSPFPTTRSSDVAPNSADMTPSSNCHAAVGQKGELPRPGRRGLPIAEHAMSRPRLRNSAYLRAFAEALGEAYREMLPPKEARRPGPLKRPDQSPPQESEAPRPYLAASLPHHAPPLRRRRR